MSLELMTVATGAAVVGAAFCAAGLPLFLGLLPIWVFLSGFTAGADAAGAALHDPFLATDVGIGAGVLGMAPVVFEEVHAPIGKGLGIDLFMVLAGRASAAGERATVGIDAKLEAASVDVIGDSFHPIREFLRVGEETAIRAATAMPVIVDDDILVTGVLQSAG